MCIIRTASHTYVDAEAELSTLCMLVQILEATTRRCKVALTPSVGGAEDTSTRMEIDTQGA